METAGRILVLVLIQVEEDLCRIGDSRWRQRSDGHGSSFTFCLPVIFMAFSFTVCGISGSTVDPLQFSCIQASHCHNVIKISWTEIFLVLAFLWLRASRTLMKSVDHVTPRDSMRSVYVQVCFRCRLEYKHLTVFIRLFTHWIIQSQLILHCSLIWTKAPPPHTWPPLLLRTHTPTAPQSRPTDLPSHCSQT